MFNFKRSFFGSKKVRRTAAGIIASILVFVTTYSLVLPAVAVENDVAENTPGISLSETSEDPVGGSEELSADASRKDNNNGETGEAASEGNDGESAAPSGDDGTSSSGDNGAENGNGKEGGAETDQSGKTGSENGSGEEKTELIAPEKIELDPDSADTAEDAEKADAEGEGSAADSEKAGDDGEKPAEDPEKSEEEDLSVAMPAVILTGETDRGSRHKSNTDNITVTVEAEEGTFPEGVQMVIADVSGDSEIYDAAIEAAEAVRKDTEKIEGAQALDITFVDKDGEKIEPLKPVKVTFSGEKIKEADDAVLVHMPDREDPETEEYEPALVEQESVLTEPEIQENEIIFKSDEFSVYAIVYTVDFWFEVDGETYSFSIPGGNFASIKEILYNLHVVEDIDAAEEFAEQIEDMEFSDPELVSVGKVTEPMTAMEILEERNVYPEFSAKYTFDDIDAILATQYEPVDWVIVGLHPFDSEESLTVTMKNGEVFVIRVTDKAGDAPVVGGQVQTIPNPNGTTIDFFDYWIADNLKTNTGQAAWPDFSNNNYTVDYGWGNTVNLKGSGTNKGINSRVGDSHGHALKFTPANAGTVADGTLNNWKQPSVDSSKQDWPQNLTGGVNSWTHGATPRTGLVENYLDGGYPKLTDNSTLGTNGESLQYLFDTGVSHSGKDSYSGVNDLLYVDPDGYYTFDSNDYDASFNKNTGKFSLTAQTNPIGNPRGFWPFGNQQYWLGMHMHTNFSMPANGKVLSPKAVNNDMIFEFQGDDDTWLYVDGILVGDGGGVHNQTLIRINFREGTAYVTGKEDAKAEYRTNYEVTNYLDNLYTAAGKYDDYEWEPAKDNDGNILYHPNDPNDPRRGQPVMTFKQGSAHEFDMFYLERGGGESNLRIHYNLISTTDFSAHKSYHNANERLNRNDFKFELIGFDNPELPGAFRQAILPQTGTPGGDGTFENPKRVYQAPTADSEGYTTIEIGATEDGNVNFGNIQVQASQVGMTYRYMVREVVDPDAENDDHIKWRNATDEQKAEGGFVDANGITYDGRTYYFTGTVRETSEGSGQYELKKTRYTDSTYTTVDTETKFFSFVNGHVDPYSLKVLKKSDTDSRKPLSGAQFSLVRAKDDITRDEDGYIISEKWVVRPESTEKTGETVNGALTFNNLKEGHYILEETAPPAGYVNNGISKWLLTMTKVDASDEIDLVPSITPLNDDGTVAGETTELTVKSGNIVEYEILNGKLPKGPITAEKKWLKPDGTTEYTPEELAELGEGVTGTEVTGELWRKATGDAAEAPTVSIYSKLDNEGTYTLRWQNQVEPGSNVLFSMAVNGTGYPKNKQYTTDTGDTVYEEANQNIYYDYTSGTQIHKSSGHVFSVRNVNHDISIYGEFDNTQASSSNNPRIGFKLVSYTAPTGGGEPQKIDEKVLDFTLNSQNGWKITWTRDELDEDDFDYEYYLKNVSEPSLEGFTFVKDPETSRDAATGSVTYSVKNIKDGPMTDLTVRKVWGDNIDHSGDTISYKIRRSDYDVDGAAVGGAYDYIERGKTAAEVYTLSASDSYNGKAWQKHHDRLPATNGKEETDPAYRSYKYSVVEVNIPANYSASYSNITEDNDGDPYEAVVIKNEPTDVRVSVEKKWMDQTGTSEITDGIPEGSYITGTLKKSYTWFEPSGTTVRVYYRTYQNWVMTNEFLYKTYTDVKPGAVFTVWAVDSSGQAPMIGADANGTSMDNNGAQHTFRINNQWNATVKGYTATINGNTDIHLNWQYNSGYENGQYYYVDYEKASGDGQPHDETETVGDFRIDDSNNWKYVWTDRELDQDHVYTYFFTDVKEHTADGTVVANFDGFLAPEVGELTQGPDGRWTATIVNTEEEKKGNLRVTKELLGVTGNEDKVYKVTIKNAAGKYLQSDRQTFGDEAYEFDLSVSQPIEVTDIPTGVYTVTETTTAGDAAIDGFTWNVEESTTEGSGEVVKDDTALVEIKNTYDEIYSPDPSDMDVSENLSIDKTWVNSDGREPSNDDEILVKIRVKSAEAYVPVMWDLYDGGVSDEADVNALSGVYYVEPGSDVDFTVSHANTDSTAHKRIRLRANVRLWGQSGSALSLTNKVPTNNASLPSYVPAPNPFTYSARDVNAKDPVHYLLQPWKDNAVWIEGTPTELDKWNMAVSVEDGKNYFDDVYEMRDALIDDSATVETLVYKLQKGKAASLVDELTSCSIRPEEVTGSGWSIGLTGLPTYQRITTGQGTDISYSYKVYSYEIEEIQVNGKTVRDGRTEDYIVTSSMNDGAASITNTEIKKVDIDAQKAWLNDDETTDAPEGASVTFELYADGEPTGKTIVLDGVTAEEEINADESMTADEKAAAIAALAEAKSGEFTAWKAEWKDLPKCSDDAQTQDIVYTVKEVAGYDGYLNQNTAGVATGGTITNKEIATSINILKVDGTTPLTGAKFMLEQFEIDGHEAIKTWPEQEVSSEEGKEGTLTFSGLTPGRYVLSETKQPDGYIIIEDSPEFTVTADSSGSLAVTFTDTDMVKFDSATNTFTVKNQAGSALPASGGPGTKLFTALGAILVLIAAAVLLWRRRRIV